MRNLLRQGFLILVLTVVCAVGVQKVMLHEDEEEKAVRAAVKILLPEEAIQETKELAIDRTKEEVKLPSYFDYRQEGRAPKVRDQERFETCWAFASLTALESSLLPEEELDFSRDHLTFHNSFGMGTDEGGSYVMSVAYLTAWQGPVYEQDDPYGDNISPIGLRDRKSVV